VSAPRSLAVALVATLPVTARAGGFELAQQSALAAGAGSAATARTGDAAAAWYNPAALADGGGLRAALGVTLAVVGLRAEALEEAADGPWQAGTEVAPSTPPHLYASFARDAWAAGLSVNLPFASQVRWPADWAQRFDVVRSRLEFVRLAPFVAYRLGPVRLAAGPQVDLGRLRVERATDHVVQEGYSTLQLTGSAWGGHLSAWAEVGSVAVGLCYRSRSALALSGEARFEVPYPFDVRYPDQHVSADWTLPDRLALGVAAPIGPVLALLDLTWTGWSVNDELALDFDAEVTEDRTQRNAWRDSLAVRAGAEWAPDGLLTLRAGAYWDGLPAPPPPDDTLSPSSPDGTRLALTAGVSVQLRQDLALDAFYEHLRLLERESTSEDAPQASYSGSAHLAGLGLRLHLR